VLMTDIRHPLKFFDEQMLFWAKEGELPVHILLTKADKLKYGASKNALLNTRQALKKLGLNCSIQLFSALRKQGLDELAGVMGNWYEYKHGEEVAKLDVSVQTATDQITSEIAAFEQQTADYENNNHENAEQEASDNTDTEQKNVK
jgi:GTP-binding protein